MGAEEAALLVCARFRHTMPKLQEIGEFFGRDPAAISDFFRAAVSTIVQRFGYLLDLDKMSQFSDHLQTWHHAFNNKFRDDFGDDLRLRFKDVNVVLDGVRLIGCKATEDNDLLVDPGNFSNLVFLVIVGGNGLIVGMSQADVGSEQDASVAQKTQLQFHLQQAGMFALCDSIFGLSANIKPLPRRNQLTVFSAAEKAAISTIRISIEWAIGEVEMKYPLVLNHYKCKVLQTLPAMLFKAAMILQNCHRCFEGCNANTYFNTNRIDIHSYLVPI